MTGPSQVSSGVRQRLAAPRGRRFSHPGSNRQSAAPPGPHRLQQQQTTLIELWGPHSHPPTAPPESQPARQERLLRQMEGDPRLAYRLQHHAVPHWNEVTRQRQAQAEQRVRQAPQARKAVRPSPTAPVGTARGRHRAPRRWWAWPAVAISAVLLFAHSQAESLGEAVFQVEFPL